jgi:hypothetical protein
MKDDRGTGPADISLGFREVAEDGVEYADSDDPEAFGEFYFDYLSRPVYDRLSDPAYFGGSSRERFDECGRGRGLAGREYIYFYDGMTESAKRAHEVYSTNVRALRKPKNFGASNFAKKKFGLQMEPVKLIYVYRNGDPFHQGCTFFVKHSIKTMRVLFRELTASLHGAAPVRELYDQQFQKIHRLSDLKNEGRYVACEGAGPTKRLSALANFLNDRAP